jgi:hypothetical protein
MTVRFGEEDTGLRLKTVFEFIKVENAYIEYLKAIYFYIKITLIVINNTSIHTYIIVLRLDYIFYTTNIFIHTT